MRKSATIMTAGVVMLGLMGAGLPAYAADRNEAVAQLVSDVAPDQGKVQAVAAAGKHLTATSDDVAVKIPLDAAAPIQVGQMAIELPAEVAVTDADATTDGTVVYTGERGSADVAVQVLQDGATRIQTVTGSAREAHEFTYTFGDDAQIAEAADGTIYVASELADGSLELLEVAAPWARDANGATVPTHYEIQGDALVQVLEPTAATQYPVVADPVYRWIQASYSAKYNKRETRNMRYAAGAATQCSWLARSFPGAAIACGAISGYIATQATIAHDNGQCVRITIAPPGLVLRYKDSDCR